MSPLPDGLFSPPIAHRGLWSPGGCPENSLGAIEQACRAGYGSEFDVRLSADGEAMVFHDASLARMAGIDRLVSDLYAGDLGEIPLLGGPDRIPSLAQVLELVAGRAMLLIELKPGPDPDRLAGRTAEVLERYGGPFAVISFDPAALAWFARHWPDAPRGLDALWAREDEAEAREMLQAQGPLADPHFLVLELEAATGPLAGERRAIGQPVIAWTVRAAEDAARVKGLCDNFIFEGFTA